MVSSEIYDLFNFSTTFRDGLCDHPCSLSEFHVGTHCAGVVSACLEIVNNHVSSFPVFSSGKKPTVSTNGKLVVWVGGLDS